MRFSVIAQTRPAEDQQLARLIMHEPRSGRLSRELNVRFSGGPALADIMARA
jgi:hypothetical protein